MGYTTNLLIMSLIVALPFIYVWGDPLPEGEAEPESGSKSEPEGEAEPERNSATPSYGPGVKDFFQIFFLLGSFLAYNILK